ncbi:XRE family transcriptional regulator [Synergistes jonesii]|uniref:HTH cro/C1-type domain-containing protein n=1 Tax=Synergistes jonesii TaxID=2754 RepID=A0A073INQ6_9BACT|nr:S24 family peptidase [Synergistes jonesii]KEJ91106.1 hypothetical protein EH55_13060 [Synergistes jonesii]
MIGERISLRQKEIRIKTNELLDIINVTGATLSRWKNNINEPDDETKQRLASALNTSVAYLMGETDDPTPPQASRVGTPDLELQSNVRPIPPENILMVPMVSPEIRLSAGNGNNYDVDAPELEFVGTWPVFDAELSAFYSDKSLSCMTVEGDSMEPQIHDGDIVVFNHSHDWVSGNVMVVCLDGRLMVKGMVSQGEGKPPILRSTNRDYMDIQVNVDSFFLVYGRVLRIIRVSKPKPVI